ncbi:MAG: hypothetical protein H8D38_00120 [DPANN group archaeon]|nr:hypothetical protein [DPANN group archaeon]
MMKKLFVGLLIVLFLLASCTSEVEEEVVVENVIPEEPSSVEEPVNDTGLGEVEEPVVEEEEEEVEELVASDVLIEKDIDDYDYEKTKSVENKKLIGFTFDAFEAHYLYGDTNAVVSVLFSEAEKVNLFDFINKTAENDRFVFLDDEEFDYLDEDVYFNPYDNMYLWVSKGRVITIQYSIGTDILEEYLEEHPTSIIKGSYDDEEVALELEGEKDEKIIFLNDNQYVLELANVDKSDNEITLEVNEEEKVVENGERAVIDNLLIEITDVSFNNEKVSLNIEREVFEKVSYQLDVNEPVEFEMNGKSNSLEITGANANTMTVMIELNGETKDLEAKQIKLLDDFDVKLAELFISTIGEQKVSAEIEVWPHD